MTKLDKFTKTALRLKLRDLQIVAAKEIAQSGKGLVEQAAYKRIKEQWADKQDDMAILAKYRHALPIRGANLRVYSPETERYDITFGVHLDPGLMMPATGGDSTYWSGYVKKDEPDYDDLLTLDAYRRSYMNAQRDEQIALDAALRKTTSYRKIIEQFPKLELDPQKVAA